MAVEEPGVIDAIGVDKATGNVVLTLLDALDWTDPTGHLVTLQAKLNRYLAFIESGEIQSSYPDAAGRSAVIAIVFRVELPAECDDFLSRARDIIESAGFELQWRVYPG